MGLDSRENDLNNPAINNSKVRQGLLKLSSTSAYIVPDKNLKLSFHLTG